MQSDLQRYFARIDYSGPAEPTLASLRQITWRHQLAIPFENLDIVLFQRPISLETPDIFAKLVDANRGGFCFEQNGLLGLILGWMGYGVSYGYATWFDEDGSEIDPFDHLVLRVEIPGEPHPWLADVGFGRQTPARPLPLVAGGEDHHPETGLTYRILPSGRQDRQWMAQVRDDDGEWKLLYEVDLTPRAMGDYEHRSRYHQTSLDSHFTRGMLCSRPAAGGRITVSGGKLILTRNGEREELPLDSRDAELSALREWFGIEAAEENGA
jgi:N-hydroxyarylamine O-acetyltransferase